MNDRSESLENQIAEESARNPQFRALLIDNPREAINQKFGIMLPADLDIHVVQRETEKQVVLVIPPEPHAIIPAPGEAGTFAATANTTLGAVLCSTTVPGGTCWNTPNCPTRQKNCPR